MDLARRSSISVVLVAGVLGLSLGGHAMASVSASRSTVSRGAHDDPFAYERALAAADPAHLPRVDGDAIALGSHTVVDARGAHVTTSDGPLVLRATAVRRTSTALPLRAAAPTVAGPEVRAERAPGITEWWRSLPSGLEHGLTIATRPAGTGELVVDVAIDGASLRLVDDHVVLLDGERERGRYGGLLVRDARGRHLTARFGIDGGAVTITIDDADARYPLSVDPLLAIAEEAILAADLVRGRAGLAVGIVSHPTEGTRAIVGAPLADGAVAGAGVARIYFLSGGVWTLEATLEPPSGEVDDFFGSAVALSGDGLFAIVGAPGDDTAAGAESGSAHVFRRLASSWSLSRTLVRSASAVADQFGAAVAMDRTGRRAIVGAPTDRVGAVAMGTASVFVRTPTSWTEEAVLSAADGASSDSLGQSVSLSDDGLFAAVGAPGDDTAGGMDAGSVRTFANVGMVWGPETTVLATGGATGDAFGSSVGLDATASRLIAGAPNDDTAAGTDAGSARVFLHSGVTWSQEAVLSDTGAADTLAGSAVAISGDGSRALVGAPGADRSGTDFGEARIHSRALTVWSEAAIYTPTTPAAREDAGAAVALTSTGDRGIVGVPNDDAGSGSGSARVITIRPADANGTACTTDASCLSGFCVDGVCCNSACGGTGIDCRACVGSITGMADGTCAVARSGTVCRGAAGVCDAPEVCNGVNPACGADARVARGEICRPAAGPCDRPDACDGTLVDCTADLRLTAGTVCNPAAGPCDVDDTCDGTSVACVAVLQAAGTTCRAAVGECDVAETCSGAGPTCPADVFAASDVTCGPAPSGACDAVDHCAGTSATCVATFAAGGTTCRDVAGPCDVAETCTGAAAGCPIDALMPADTACAPASGACDVEDVCDGTNAACVARVAGAGTICRASTASCDPAESCEGTATTCPADITACDAGVDVDAGIDVDAGELDAGELDAGIDVDVGADMDATVAEDVGPGDGGPRDGGTSDGGPTDGGGGIDTGADGGTTAPMTGGCACRVGHGAQPREVAWLGAALLATVLVGRRRRGRRGD